MSRFTLGINLGFATNRFPEPNEWARIVRQELGLSSVQLVADLLNPFWPQDVLDAEVARIRRATDEHGIAIDSLMTSTYTRVNHFMYPYPELRAAWVDWFHRFAELGATLGAKAVGSHFGILSVRDLREPERYRQRLDDAVASWQQLTHRAGDLGLEYVFFETMSVPREMGYTVQQARELHDRVNEGAGVPFCYCLDVGHAPHPDERDPYPWLAELGRDTRIVHLQQTEFGHSRHWPFTPEYNEIGIIQPRRVVDALVASGADQVWLGFEISHRERYEVEPTVIPDLRASAEYWREQLDGYLSHEASNPT